MRVLVTRPEPDATRTAARLRELGHQVVLSPVLMIEPVSLDQPLRGPFAALAATSANAPRIAGALVEFDAMRSTPLFAVGHQTADAARQAGFKQVVSADGDAVALAQRVAKALPPGARLLHLAGDDRAKDLGALLASAGIRVEVVVLYRARAAVELPVSVAAALASGDIDAVLHYSSNSATVFVALIEQQGLATAAQRIQHYCLSAAAAAPLEVIGIRARVAAHPNETELIALLQT